MDSTSSLYKSLVQPFRNTTNGCETTIIDIPNLIKGGQLCCTNFIVDTTEDTIEIPVFARSQIEDALQQNPDVQKIIIPLYTMSEYIKSKKTFNTMISYLFKDVFYSDKLRGVEDGKGNKWYGNAGIIFNSELKPLVLCTLRLKRTSEGWLIDRYICHINPIVFEDQNDMMNKGIIKKLIPVYANEDINVYFSSYFRNRKGETSRPKVIIDDFSSFFISPVKPVFSEHINDTLNDVLIDNIEEIVAKV